MKTTVVNTKRYHKYRFVLKEYLRAKVANTKLYRKYLFVTALYKGCECMTEEVARYSTHYDNLDLAMIRYGEMHAETCLTLLARQHRR